MLTELYIEALLVDEELDNQIWYVWESCVIDDELATIEWFLTATSCAFSPCRRD